jgi:hypothetical protein
MMNSIALALFAVGLVVILEIWAWLSRRALNRGISKSLRRRP